jgi:predicted phage replisome organizer
MEKDKKYFWLKLKKDFFKRHDIRIIEGMPNGKDYVLFYLKLLLESIDHNGELRFNETIPYNENMLSTITNTNVDIVRNALKLLSELDMIELLDNDTIYMSEVTKMLGSETYWAEKKRKQRKVTKVKQIPTKIKLLDNVQSVQVMSKQEIETELDLELEKDNNTSKNKDKKIEFAENVTMTQKQYNDALEKYGQTKLDRMIEILSSYKCSSGKKYKSDYHTFASWVSERYDQEKLKTETKGKFDDVKFNYVGG